MRPPSGQKIFSIKVGIMKRKTWKWLVIVLLLTVLFSSCGKGDDNTGMNKEQKQNDSTMRYDPGGLLEIQKKSTKRLKAINDNHMKELQDTQKENSEGNNEN
jgi:hypothetical protein